MATEKENTVQVAHIEGDKEHTLSHAAALELHESRSTWQVVKANPRICIIIAVVQVLVCPQYVCFIISNCISSTRLSSALSKTWGPI